MIEETKNGWCWHFRIFNYLTKEMNAFNSPKPFKTYEEALLDLMEFIRKKISEVENV